MDPDLLTSAGLSTTGVALLLLAYRILKSVKGKKLVSSCCGRKLELGMDVQEMTPQPDHKAITIQNPMKNGSGKEQEEGSNVSHPVPAV